MTDVLKTSSAAGAGRPKAVAAGEEADTEHEVRRVLALRLGTTTRAELDDAAVSLSARVAALAGDLLVGAEGMSAACRGFLLEIDHLLDNPPPPKALSHEIHSHVRALARVLRKLAAMNRARDAVPAISPLPPLPVRPVPERGRGTER